MPARRLASEIVEVLSHRGLTITTMESCTGGALVNAITDVQGASAVLHSAYITYSNSAKVARGVPHRVIHDHTVYSLETAQAMAQAAIKEARADVAVGITGSLNRVDPANKERSEPGTVYVAVFLSTGKGLRREIRLEPSQPREASKKMIVEESIRMVLELRDG